jgi:hypothetical protein
MSKHTVTVDELNTFLEKEWVIFASSQGDGSNKRISANLGGLYKVTSHDRTLYIGGIKSSAVAEYNSAP